MPASSTAARLPLIHVLVVAAWLTIVSTATLAATATLEPSADNTIAEDFPDNSSGECDSIFSGNTDNNVARRALMQFDIAGQIPAGAIINSVTLSMTVTRGGNHASSVFSLHRITTPWGEGTNTCGTRGGGQGEPAVTGSATWNDAESGINPWGSPGGDYNGMASGSTQVNSSTPVWNSTSAMISDVQDWLDNPGTNYGWILIGDEVNPTTTRRFDSSEGGSSPQLLVDFTPTGAVEACCEADGSCSLTLEGSGTCGGSTQGTGTTCEPNLCPQPTGACCNPDNSCENSVDKLICESGGGTFVGGNCNQADCGLAPFVEALPIPAILPPTGTRADGVLQYTVSVQQTTQSVHPDLPDTTVWTYNGAWPAATIVATKGTPIEVTYQNNLPTGGGKRGSDLLEVDTCAHGPNYWGKAKRVVTHLHGGHVPSRVDGQPEYTLLPGESDVYEYPNNQDAATTWYHDHALGITRLNVYGGMAGFYLIRDDEDTLGLGNQASALSLPTGPYEIGLAIQDRSFNDDGSLFYNAQLEDAFKGDYAVVNGKISPYLEVDQGKYRFRILNGSQSREYSLRLENMTDPGNDPDFILIGTDLGLLSAPINLGPDFKGLQPPGLQAPAERMDVVIDFAGFPAGTEIILRNDETTPPLLPSIMKFIVTSEEGYTGAIPPTLRNVPDMPEASADGTRYFRLAKVPNQECKDGSGRLVNEWLVQSLDGPGGTVIAEEWDDLSEFPVLGTREIWEFENPTNSMHPMHVHLVRFQILDKTDMTTGLPIPLEPWEINTWKDIVRIPANSKARIIMDFEDYLGRFPQHCHILDHEDHEMMRQYQTTFGYCNDNGTCDPGEDCHSCALILSNDCGQVSGALCGNGLCEAGDDENCVSCPQDCAGKQTGAAAKQYCCGSDDGQVTNPAGWDGCRDPSVPGDNRCIDAGSNLFCRLAPRVPACCGDQLCEGQESIASCANDCDPNACVPSEPGIEYSCADGEDNDCDDQTDGGDTDCQDDDNDGLPNGVETNDDNYVDPMHTGTDPGASDTDSDGLEDGEEVNTYQTDPTNDDTDGDLLLDGLEVANGADPNDPASFPHFETCDVAPRDSAPDGNTNAGDLVVAMQLALGLVETSKRDLAYCDMSQYDDVIDARDISRFLQMLLAQ